MIIYGTISGGNLPIPPDAVNFKVYWPAVESAPIVIEPIEGGGGEPPGPIQSNNLGNYVGYIVNNSFYLPAFWQTYSATPKLLSLNSNVGTATDGIAEAINDLGFIVGFLIVNNKQIPVYWTNKDADPIALRLDSNLGTGTNGTADSFTTLNPISNICFPSGTPILTDQGIVPIDHIDIKKHTINSQSICNITKTVTLDKYLICFNKGSLGVNTPNKTTIMSKDHQIMFDGKLVSAYRCLELSSNIKKVKYNGEVLYNVLLDKHSIINVNGLHCETLHPDNIIAKLYKNYSEGERQSIIFHMNNALSRKDESTYKDVINKLTLQH